MTNCKVLGYYGGIQKLTALMKGMLLDIVGVQLLIIRVFSFCGVVDNDKYILLLDKLRLG